MFYTDLNKVVIGRQAPAYDDLIYVNQNFLFPSTRSCGILKKYPGIAKLVSRLVWDQETVRSSRTTRTKTPLKSLISEGFFLFFVYCGVKFDRNYKTYG